MADSIIDIAGIIRGRRSISLFKPEVPPREVILQAIDVACWAPNHRLTEPWQFHLLGPETTTAIVQLNAELVTAKKGAGVAAAKLRHWSSMPGWLVIACERSEDPIRAQEDYAACACVAQNLALFLWNQGIGMKWSTGDVTRSQEFFRLLALDPATMTIVGLFWYGYPLEIPAGRRSSSIDHVYDHP